ncbi:MAG: hypothetical protein IK149_03580 [Oscillospiraceae bacterium]|nr:hypothetical protein [Oscillospiraceae bacterium]
MERKRLTKWTLIWRSAKEVAGAFSVIFGLVALFLFVGGLLHHTALPTLLLLTGAYLLLMELMVLIIVQLGLIKGLFLLAQQEKLFGFRFSDENLDPDNPDGRWFISTDFYLLAFRRGYISRGGKIRELSGWGMSEMELWDCEGKKHRIRGKYKDLKALKQWLDAERPEAEDDRS